MGANRIEKPMLNTTRSLLNNALASGLLILLFSSACVALASEPVQEPEQRVAGRSLTQWHEELASPSEIARLRAVKSLASFGAPAEASLIEALDDESEGVRYWAASALGDQQSHAALAKLAEHFRMGNDAERLAMAYALVRGIKEPAESDEQAALQTAAFGLMVERLRASERSMVMCAADFIGRLGSEGRAAMEELETIYFEHHVDENPIRRADADYHLSGACLNALRMIDPLWRPTRF